MTRTLKCWHSFDIAIADAEGFNAYRKQHESTRIGEGVKVRRSPQAVACRKRGVRELGKPQWAPDVGTAEAGYTDIEAQMGKPGNGTRLEPTLVWANHESGGRETARSAWGVLSGRVLGGGESPLQGEGPDGSTQPAQETRAGHVGLDHHEPTSLQGRAHRAKVSKDHRFQNLYQCVNATCLRECWHDLNKDAASGVDGVTAAQYQENLEENIQDLVRRLETQCYHAK